MCIFLCGSAAPSRVCLMLCLLALADRQSRGSAAPGQVVWNGKCALRISHSIPPARRAPQARASTEESGRERSDEEILDHLDQRGGTRLLDLTGCGSSQAVLIMLHHDERRGHPGSFQQARQLLRVMRRDKPVVGSLDDQ